MSNAGFEQYLNCQTLIHFLYCAPSPSASFCEEVGIIIHTYIKENQYSAWPLDLLRSSDS